MTPLAGITSAIDDFVAAISGLSKANRKTGIWDNRRFNLCKRPFEELSESDKAYLYKTEKNSRKNVELRATYRCKIDRSLEMIVSKRGDGK